MNETYRIHWAPVALQDFEEILEYIASQDSVDASSQIASKILDRIESLKVHPRRCRIVPELKEFGVREYRELIVHPYRIFYRIVKKDIGIVGVLDGRRNLEEVLIRRLLVE